MSGKRYSEEFKIEAVGQVKQRGYSVSDVSSRLGITPKSLYELIRKFGDPDSAHQELTAQQAEVRRLRSEFRRVTEERDILKEAAVYYAGESRKGTPS